MNPGNQNIDTDEIDLVEIFLKLWKEKFSILFISLLFSVLAYVNTAFKPKTFETRIVLKNVPKTMFLNYESLVKSQKNINFADILQNNFVQKLKSFDNLDLFVKQNNQIDSFKAFLKEREISAKNYFLNGSNSRFGTESANIYYLNFPKELKGDEFLNEYILFAFKQSENETKDEIMLVLSSLIESYNKDLSIAKQLNIIEPILQQRFQDNNKVFLLNEPKNFYYSGTKVIQNEIDTLNAAIAELKNLKIDYNPVIDLATKPKNISKSTRNSTILGFAVGLFLSLIYIYLKNLIKVKNNK